MTLNVIKEGGELQCNAQHVSALTEEEFELSSAQLFVHWTVHCHHRFMNC